MFLEILTDVATNQMNIWCGAAQFLLEFLGRKPQSASAFHKHG